MTKQRAVFWVGLAMYAVSFVLVAVVDRPYSAPGGVGFRGYECAWYSLLLPLGKDGNGPAFGMKVSMLGAGLINPFFIAAVIARLAGAGRTYRVAMIGTLILIPVSMIVFRYDVYPREGYGVWVVGMLVVLFTPGVKP